MNKQEIKSLIAKIDEDLTREKEEALPPLDKKLNEVARRLLQLERDLSVPGAPSTDLTRRERVLRFLEEEDF